MFNAIEKLVVVAKVTYINYNISKIQKAMDVVVRSDATDFIKNASIGMGRIELAHLKAEKMKTKRLYPEVV